MPTGPLNCLGGGMILCRLHAGVSSSQVPVVMLSWAMYCHRLLYSRLLWPVSAWSKDTYGVIPCGHCSAIILSAGDRGASDGRARLRLRTTWVAHGSWPFTTCQKFCISSAL